MGVGRPGVFEQLLAAEDQLAARRVGPQDERFDLHARAVGRAVDDPGRIPVEFVVRDIADHVAVRHDHPVGAYLRDDRVAAVAFAQAGLRPEGLPVVEQADPADAVTLFGAYADPAAVAEQALGDVIGHFGPLQFDFDQPFLLQGPQFARPGGVGHHLKVVFGPRFETVRNGVAVRGETLQHSLRRRETRDERLDRFARLGPAGGVGFQNAENPVVADPDFVLPHVAHLHPDALPFGNAGEGVPGVDRRLRQPEKGLSVRPSDPYGDPLAGREGDVAGHREGVTADGKEPEHLAGPPEYDPGLPVLEEHLGVERQTLVESLDTVGDQTFELEFRIAVLEKAADAHLGLERVFPEVVVQRVGQLLRVEVERAGALVDRGSDLGRGRDFRRGDFAAEDVAFRQPVIDRFVEQLEQEMALLVVASDHLHPQRLVREVDPVAEAFHAVGDRVPVDGVDLAAIAYGESVAGDVVDMDRDRVPDIERQRVEGDRGVVRYGVERVPEPARLLVAGFRKELRPDFHAAAVGGGDLAAAETLVVVRKRLFVDQSVVSAEGDEQAEIDRPVDIGIETFAFRGLDGSGTHRIQADRFVDIGFQSVEIRIVPALRFDPLARQQPEEVLARAVLRVEREMAAVARGVNPEASARKGVGGQFALQPLHVRRGQSDFECRMFADRGDELVERLLHGLLLRDRVAPGGCPGGDLHLDEGSVGVARRVRVGDGDQLVESAVEVAAAADAAHAPQQSVGRGGGADGLQGIPILHVRFRLKGFVPGRGSGGDTTCPWR